MGSFVFRLRVGDLDWKAITSIDISSLIELGQTEELQSILDMVTFCSFQEIDVKRSSVQSITKLVQLMQLIIEYLLFSQESQCKLVREFHFKNTTLKKAIRCSQSENLSLKEDVKIYQRQLQLLQQSTHNMQHMIKNPHEPRVVTVPEKTPSFTDDSKALQPTVESVMRHEKETREFIRDIIEDERTTFMDQLNRFVSNATLQSERGQQKMALDLKQQAESLLNATTSAMQESAAAISRQKLQLQELVTDLRANEVRPRENLISALAARESILASKEAALQERERLLAEESLKLKEKALTLQRLNDSMTTVNTPVVVQAPALSRPLKALVLRYLGCHVGSRSGLKFAFAYWLQTVIRQQVTSCREREDGLRLEVSVLQQRLREEEQHVKEERSKTLVEASRHNALVRRMEKERLEREAAAGRVIAATERSVLLDGSSNTSLEWPTQGPVAGRTVPMASAAISASTSTAAVHTADINTQTDDSGDGRGRVGAITPPVPPPVSEVRDQAFLGGDIRWIEENLFDPVLSRPLVKAGEHPIQRPEWTDSIGCRLRFSPGVFSTQTPQYETEADGQVVGLFAGQTDILLVRYLRSAEDSEERILVRLPYDHVSLVWFRRESTLLPSVNKATFTTPVPETPSSRQVADVSVSVAELLAAANERVKSRLSSANALTKSKTFNALTEEIAFRLCSER